MAESVVDICNRALSTAGVSAMIEDLDQVSSVEAEQCRLWYARLRDELLRDRVWKFATRRAVLALVAGETRTDWTYVYALPSNCLKVRALIQPGGRSPWVVQGQPWTFYQGATSFTGVPAATRALPMELEAQVDGAGAVIGQVLLCDLEDAELLYTVRVENPQVFAPDFEAALEYYLASKLARALAKDPARARELEQAYEMSCRKAGANAVNETVPDPEGASSFEAARY